MRKSMLLSMLAAVVAAAENGNNDVHWLKVDADPDSRDVFSFQPQIVPGNRTAVPAP